MCGFVVSARTGVCELVQGKKIGPDTLARGPDLYQSVVRQIGDINYFIEFAHLFITKPNQKQPFESESHVLVIIGEIYNYAELVSNINVDGFEGNDTFTFFQHVEHFGLQETLKIANGMFAGFILNKSNGKCFAFTDYLGKKPLVVWNSFQGWHVGTGLDTNYVDGHTTSIQALSPGLYQLNLKNGSVNFSSYPVQMLKQRASLFDALCNAVAIRIPKNVTFAVTLSGGLDSAIIAYILEKQLGLTPNYYVLGEVLPKQVEDLMKHLNIPYSRIILIRPSSQGELLMHIHATCSITKSRNPSIISNGVATLMLTRVIHQDDYKVIICGEGADEFFCGYQAMYSGQHDPELMRNALIENLHFTELRRLDLVTAHFSVEARCPFLDVLVTRIALAEPLSELCCQTRKCGKLILRKIFTGLLPNSIINSPKEPFDITSGLQKKIIDLLTRNGESERAALLAIQEKKMKRLKHIDTPYFSEYPCFDKMIDKRANKYLLKSI